MIQPRSSFTAFASILLPLAFIGGCAEPEPLQTSESELDKAGNCSFIPGCKQLLDASDGPFSASLTVRERAGGGEQRDLSVTYRPPPESSFLDSECARFPGQPSVTLVFVVGPEGARTSVQRPMTVSCPRSYGDNLQHPNNARFSVNSDDPLWDVLFPPKADGSRWYAARVALVDTRGVWDSRFGDDYRLVLTPR